MRLALVAALLLPLAACTFPGAKRKQVALPAHILLEAIKWKRKDAEAVASLHAVAPGLLHVHHALQVASVTFIEWVLVTLLSVIVISFLGLGAC